MANEPDPPKGEPDPPKEWRVYEGDDTPDPEPPPPAQPPIEPYAAPPPNVPYGQPQPAYNPIVVRSSSGGATKLIMIVIALAVLGGGVAAAIAIFSAVGGVAGIGGIDSHDPDDFAKLVDEVEEKTGNTDVFWVGLYDGYVVVDIPYTDDPADDREVSYRWDGGDLTESSKSTSTDLRFDLSEIDPSVIDGMCDPVLEEAQGSTPKDCYIFISKPSEDYDNNVWFRSSASDEFGKSYWVNYDKLGKEVDRGHS